MNKGYAYVDGKVIISDENGKQVLGEYYDNLDDVLVEENVIETMENRIAELEKDSQSYKKNNRKRYIPFRLPIVAFMSTAGVNLIFYFLSGTNPFMSSMDTIFGVVNEGVFFSCFFSTFFIPIGTLYEISSYVQYKDLKKRENGTNSELEFLKKRTVEKKQALEALKKEKKRQEEVKESSVVEVDDKEALNNLKNHLRLYYDLGYNGEKYFRYLQQGKLDEKLREYYNDTQIGVAKEYLEEKGPTLAKKKTIDNQNNWLSKSDEE